MRPVAPGLSPNVKSEDAHFAFKLLLSPWKYFQNSNTIFLEKWFTRYFKGYNAFAFTSGRGALYSILKNSGVGKGDEVIVQAFTCVAVVDAVVTTGAKPIYADINNNLTMDEKSLVMRISPKTKAVIFQHTFGASVNLEKITKIARNKKLLIIEDAAHCVGTSYQGRKIGTWGDGAIFSFGRDKAFSSVSGGIAITANRKIAQNLSIFQKERDYPSFLWVFQQLFHPVIFTSIILPLYDFLSFGKVILVVLQQVKLLSRPIEQTKAPFVIYAHKLPGSIASLAMLQLKRLREFNKQREDISRIYLKVCDELGIKTFARSETAYLRFPIWIQDPKDMKIYFRHKGIYLGDWYSHVIDPKDTQLLKVYYKKGECPNAEEVSRHIINLPTYPAMSQKDIQKVLRTLKSYDYYSRNKK